MPLWHEKNPPALWSQTLAKAAGCDAADETHSYLDLLRTPQLRKISLLSGFLWFSVAFLYYSISFRISGLGVSIYLAHFIYGAVETPAKILCYFLLDRIGRRNGQAGFLMATGALVAINAAVPTGERRRQRSAPTFERKELASRARPFRLIFQTGRHFGSAWP